MGVKIQLVKTPSPLNEIVVVLEDDKKYISYGTTHTTGGYKSKHNILIKGVGSRLSKNFSVKKLTEVGLHNCTFTSNPDNCTHPTWKYLESFLKLHRAKSIRPSTIRLEGSVTENGRIPSSGYTVNVKVNGRDMSSKLILGAKEYRFDLPFRPNTPYQVEVVPFDTSLQATTVPAIITKATLAESSLQCETVQLLPKERVERNMTISIKDASTGNALSGFNLEIFNHNNQRIFGISSLSSSHTQRLPIGHYRVSVSKSGYQETVGKLCAVSNQIQNNCPISLVPAVGRVFRDTLKDGGQGPQMVVLPTGSFQMGSPPTESGRDNDEGPVRTVTISRRIAIGRYEVTFADYDRFVAARSGTRRPADSGWGRGAQPVIDVHWVEARNYAAWLTAQTGKTYRLPTEAEWEYAARAGTTTAYHFGSFFVGGSIRRDLANCQGCNTPALNQTTPVGRFAANAFGLHDMHGNVQEWVQDCYVNTYAGAPIDGSARTSGCGFTDVLRSGSWSDARSDLRSASRTSRTSGERTNNIGFRLVRELSP